ncbi:histidine kinase [Pedobacter sp. FW305-3-2-15-E-R2A2]|uniref:sensor histidine kinase n=1 Tax=Pedobacter sp. FW305-3-2-15-E-R2A2 TaxID=3140251 RepID=UPI00314095C4
MKTRFRQYEIIFISIVTVIVAVGYFWIGNQIQNHHLSNVFEIAYIKRNLTFDYNRNILFPQLGALLIFYGCYIGINLLVSPVIRSFFGKSQPGFPLAKVLVVVFSAAFLSLMLSVGINWISSIAHPAYFNYNSFGLVSLLGYNERPLENLLFGIDRAAGLICLLMVATCISAFAAFIIEKKQDSVVMIANKIALILGVYFIVAVLLFTFGFRNEPFFRFYFCFLPPVGIVYFFNKYFLFPLYGTYTIFNLRLLSGILLSTFIVTLAFISFSSHEDVRLSVFIVWLFQLIVVTPVSWLMFQQQKDVILKFRVAQIELGKSKSDLYFLRSQINPHFLFNSLNTLYGTALVENSTKTAEGIQMLGDMMRFMLHDNNSEFILMSREIEYLENYIAFQKLRIQDSPTISVSDRIDNEGCNCMIAPMLFIPFVENAFKYGIDLLEESQITIRLDCNEDTIDFEVVNNIHAAQNTDLKSEQSGTGIQNVKDRLELIYKNKYDLKINDDGKQFTVRLKLQV